MSKKKLDKKRTIQNILWLCNSRGYRLDTAKFNKKKDNVAFLKRIAESIGAEIVYDEADYIDIEPWERIPKIDTI